MDAALTINDLVKLAIVVMGIWGFVKVIMEIAKAITQRHDREQSWDEAVKNINKERETITNTFSLRLDEQDAKIQQLYAMMIMLMKAQNACLEGLIEQGCNGDVKKMHHELNDFIAEQIGQ